MAALAPVLVVLQAEVATPGGSSGGGGGGDEPPAPLTAGASKLAAAMSSRRPVFGFYATHGVTRTPPVGVAGSHWYGASEDFMFQLHPELNVFPVSTAEVETRASGTSGGGAVYTPVEGAAGGDVTGTAHRVKLARSRFLTCTDEYLLVGGNPAASGAQALMLRDNMETALASRDFLADMSVPEARTSAVAGDVRLSVLAVEVYGFIDRVGSFMATDMHASTAARAQFVSSLHKFWRPSPEHGATAPTRASPIAASAGGAVTPHAAAAFSPVATAMGSSLS